MNDLFEKIRRAWSKETCYPGLRQYWNENLPETGQCSVTALIVQEYFGGIIVFNKEHHHYWNILQEHGEIDLTRKQFAGIEHMHIDGYKPVMYFLDNEDTYSRYQELKKKVKEDGGKEM